MADKEVAAKAGSLNPLREWSFPMATVRLEAPDLFINDMSGPGRLDGSTMAGVRDALLEALQGNPHTFWILNLGTLSGLSDEAREVLRNWRSVDCAGFVVYGGSLVFRTTIQLVHRGLYLLGRAKVPMDMVKDEEEARALIARRRSNLASAA